MSLAGFTSPLWFLLLVVIAALVAGYVWMQRRRRRQGLGHLDGHELADA